ncbi:MAG: formyltransferase family protein [Candidatus Paceibacterota bacterium]
MSIVVITIPGEDKNDFIHKLHQQTGGKIDLVIIQKTKPVSILGRLYRFLTSLPVKDIPREIWYSLLLRLNKKNIHALNYFRDIKAYPQDKTSSPRLKILETDSVNSDEVYQTLKTLSPKVLAIWGSKMLEPRIIQTATKAINLHFGYCPYYRGAVANQHAVLCGDFEKIGATIHYVNDKPDAGDILTTIRADLNHPPKILFQNLHHVAINKYIEIISDLYLNKELIATPQNISLSKNLLLKSWTPSKRYMVAKAITEWEKNYPLAHK